MKLICITEKEMKHHLFRAFGCGCGWTVKVSFLKFQIPGIYFYVQMLMPYCITAGVFHLYQIQQLFKTCKSGQMDPAVRR